MTSRPSISLPKHAFVDRLVDVFALHGRELYLVGGSVRDAILGRDIGDLDFATDAHPPEVKRLVRAAAPSSIYTVGERFGTIGAVFDYLHVEITTYRTEHYEPRSRKPDVEFGTSLEGDLSRRDFTINAMALEVRSGRLVDPFCGERDLGLRLIRAVGSPEERFEEDPLRMLRAVRFAVQLDFRIDQSTVAAIRRQAANLAHISRERIAQEMNRILVEPRAAHGIRLLCDLGLMPSIVPEILEMRGMSQDTFHHKDVFEHTLQVLSNVPAVLHLRWAALLHDVAKPRTRSVDNGEVHFFGHERLGEQMTRRILSSLRYDREMVMCTAKLVGMHLRPNTYEPDWTDGAVRRFMREAGEELADLLALSRADVTSRRTEKRFAAARRVDELQARIDDLRAREDVARLQSPLDGNELMQMFGLGPGPWIRTVKDHLLNLVLDGSLAPDDKATAAEIAQELLQRETDHVAGART
jgi:poly(A) polymerase